MKEKRTLIDTFTGRIYLVGPGGYELKLSPGSVQHDLVESSAGHLMLPCSCFNTPMKHREEVTSFIVGDYFDSTPTRSSPSRSSGGGPPTNSTSEFNGAETRRRLDRLVASARPKRQD